MHLRQRECPKRVYVFADVPPRLLLWPREGLLANTSDDQPWRAGKDCGNAFDRETPREGGYLAG